MQDGETRERVVAAEHQLKALERIVELLHSDLANQMRDSHARMSSDLKDVKQLISSDHDQLVKNTQSVALLSKIVAAIGTAVLGLIISALKGALGI